MFICCITKSAADLCQRFGMNMHTVAIYTFDNNSKRKIKVDKYSINIKIVNTLYYPLQYAYNLHTPKKTKNINTIVKKDFNQLRH